MFRRRNYLIKIIAWIIIISIIGAFLINFIFAQQAIPSTPPRNIRVTEIAYQDAGWQNWFARFFWDEPGYPDEATGDRFQSFYFNKVERGTGILREDVTTINMGDGYRTLATSGSDGYGIELDHGTIYEFYGRSSYTYGDLNQFTFTSGRSNRVRFLTHVEFGAELISGTNEIKIVWDDIWDTDGRINYRILISDTSGFTQPPPIPDIIGSTIGTNDSRITVSGGRLEYVYTNALPGREYSIKVIPLVKPDVSVVSDDELPVVQVKTEILLRAKKMGETADGVRWMLFWDPIIKGSIGSTTFTKVEYKLYRYDSMGNETLFAEVTDMDRFEMNLRPEDVEKYRYKVEAVAYKNDGSTVPFYSTTLVSLKEQIPEYPAAPEFVSGFPTADPSPLIFDDFLTESSATLLWTPPVTGEGNVDTEVYYDLYLVERLDDIEMRPPARRIASNFTVDTENEVREKDTGKLLGYRYTIDNMTSNSTYYAVMIAKKNYLTDSGDGFMLTRPYLSDSAVKVIITRPDTETDKPLSPPSPPFRLKPGEAVGDTGFTLQMEKSWVELYHVDLKKWLYVIRQDDPELDDPNGFYNEHNAFTYDEYIANRELDEGDANKKPERIVNYNAGYEVKIHCVEYEDALRTVKSLRGRDFISYSDLTGNYLAVLEKPIDSVIIPDIPEDEPQAFSLPVEGLEPNTTYLVWVSVKNRTGLMESDPSDPILVTTKPDFPPHVEVPVVPTDLKGIPADTYVDLFWSFRTGYSYNICYGTEDDREKALGTVRVSSEQLRYEPWYRIGSLTADTVYYFWIQAISPNDTGGSVLSDWSNSLVVKTEPYAPPPKPRGFGIKNTPDAITQTSIDYEWLPDESVTFILEISERADFTDSQEYTINDSEFQVTGLKSNYRYFARLFSYDSHTGLRSEPSPVVMVVTRKGRGEYDADVPLDDIPIGEMLIIDPVAIDGIWTAKATGINAHRLSEKIRQEGKGTFSIDLTKPPPNTRIIRLELDGEVLETLSGVRESLLMVTPGFELFILPGSFLQDEYFRLKRNFGDIAVRVDIRTPAHELQPENLRQFIAPVTEMKVFAGLEKSFMPLGEFIRPVKITLPVEDAADIEKIQMRYYDSNRRQWEDIENSWLPEQEKLAAYPKKSGAAALTSRKNLIYRDVNGSGINQTIDRIMRVYAMPSLQNMGVKMEKALSVADGMKHLMDIIPFEYRQSDVMETALRAGLIIPRNLKDADSLLRRDEAIYAALMVLGKKTGQEISSDMKSLESFDDASQVLEPYRMAMDFAVSKGIIRGDHSGLAPQRAVTQQELLLMIERILIIAGEL